MNWVKLYNDEGQHMFMNCMDPYEFVSAFNVKASTHQKLVYKMGYGQNNYLFCKQIQDLSPAPLLEPGN